MFQQIHKNKVL